MIILFVLLCFVMIYSLRFHYAGLDQNYNSKEYTQSIKGIFVIIVFLSHVRTYADFTTMGDQFVIQVLNYFGQLMVALFLFYSGYGIYESIKHKGKKYIDSLPIHRIGKIFFDFSLAIILFLILDLFIGRHYSLPTILLSFTGWTSVGNSAWYMFAIFTLYILTYLSFRICDHKKIISICLMTLLSLGYVYIMSLIRDNYWSSTYLCYVAGMWYSYFKEKIDVVFQQYYIIYYIVTFLTIILYIYFFQYRYTRLMMFNVVAILFCLIFVFLSMKLSFHSQILSWMGGHLFWIYILQRIPMILFQYYHIHEWDPYLYLSLCFVATIILAYYINCFANYLKKKVFKSTYM